MKRIECAVAVASIVAAVASASAMIPEQVRVETGLLAGTVSTTECTSFQGNSLCCAPTG
jgi:hypothetical protein